MRARWARAIGVGLAVGVCSSALGAVPDRPAPLTAEQFTYLTVLQDQPEHAAVREVHATYTSEHERNIEATRLANDITTGMWQAGLPAVIIAMLIAAAPL